LAELDDDGSANRLAVYGKDRRSVQMKLREAVRRLEADLPAKDASMTVADWIDAWAATILAASNRKETTAPSTAGSRRRTSLQRPSGRCGCPRSDRVTLRR
jgi:hypothetical protein